MPLRVELEQGLRRAHLQRPAFVAPPAEGGGDFPRRTDLSKFETIDLKEIYGGEVLVKDVDVQTME